MWRLQPVEGLPFSGIVASFTDTDSDVAADYAATIDWGDGTTSAGVVTSNNANGFGFAVSGTHTYNDEGAYPVIVSLSDADGSSATASETTFSQRLGGAVTYRVSVDTSALAGTSGFLDFQLNPGGVAEVSIGRRHGRKLPLRRRLDRERYQLRRRHRRFGQHRDPAE